MIKVDVDTNVDGFMSIHVTGHADTRTCASVSTLLQSNVRFLQELSQQFPEQLKVKINGGTQ